jgi:hypothetical protein
MPTMCLRAGKVRQGRDFPLRKSVNAFASRGEGFEAKYPRVDVLHEAAGSQGWARKITDLHKPSDIMTSATILSFTLAPQCFLTNLILTINHCKGLHH